MGKYGSHQTEYGYRSELGEHEIWAESPWRLAQVMLGASVTWTDGGRRRAGRLDIVGGRSIAEFAVCIGREGDAAETLLPKHVYVRSQFGQFEPRTPDTIVMYKLVVRETFRSVQGG